MHTCVHVYVHMHMSAGACGSQGPADSLELELQVVVGCPKQRLGTQIRSTEPLLQTYDLSFTADNYHKV